MVELVDHHLFQPRVHRRSQCCGHRCVHRRQDGSRAPRKILCLKKIHNTDVPNHSAGCNKFVCCFHCQRFCVPECVEWPEAPGTPECVGKPFVAVVGWTTKGAVTPVKDQRRGASYLTLSTTSSLKGASSIAIGLLLPLCEQQLVGFQFVRGHVDVIHTTFAQILSHRLKGGEFVRLTTSEFVSQFTGHLLSKVWSGPKHVVAHEHVGRLVERCCEQGKRPCSHETSLFRELSSSAQFLFPQGEGVCVC